MSGLQPGDAYIPGYSPAYSDMGPGLQPEDAQDGGADRHVERGEAGGPGDGGQGADEAGGPGDGGQGAGEAGGPGDGGQGADEADGPGDGGQGADSPEPWYDVEFRWAWQVHLGSGVWQDANPMWTEPLFRALRDGVRTIRLSHKYQKESGEYVESAYTIDCINATHVTQQNLSSGKRRALRAVYIIMPHGYTLPVPPPTESPAHPADPDPEDWPWMRLSRSASSSQS